MFYCIKVNYVLMLSDLSIFAGVHSLLSLWQHLSIKCHYQHCDVPLLLMSSCWTLWLFPSAAARAAHFDSKFTVFSTMQRKTNNKLSVQLVYEVTSQNKVSHAINPEILMVLLRIKMFLRHGKQELKVNSIFKDRRLSHQGRDNKMWLISKKNKK